MTRPHRLPAVLAAALGILAPAAAQPPASPNALVRLAHDANYLYAAWEVDDTHLSGVSRGVSPGSYPAILQDDTVALHVRAGAKRVALIVSVAGGFAFLDNGAPIPLFAVKFAPSTRGTLNRGDDRDRGYDVEQAIPWSALGVTPGSGEIQVCLAVTKRGADAPSLYPAGARLDAPETWGKLSLQAGDGLSAPPVATPPQIDGVLKASEWAGAGVRFAVSDPAPAAAPILDPLPLEPLLPADRLAPALAAGALLEPRRVFARHLPTHNADLIKRTAPSRGIFGTDGGFLAIDQPTIGFGPWYSSDRPGWHRQELAEMARAGVDTALTVVNGVGLNTSPFDAKALTMLVAARREMEREREPAPDLALWLETGTLSAVADLATDAGCEILYKSVARWFELVPPSMRARVRVPARTPSGTVLAYPVFLNDAAGVTNADAPGWADALRARFAADFGALSDGATLVFVGAKGYDAARMPLIASLPESGPGAGAVPAAVVRPGSQSPFVPRRFGDAYRASWNAARDARWVVIDSWNDFAAATEIAPSRQYGDGYVGLTRLFRATVLPENAPAAAIAFESPDLPRRLRPGQLLPTDFRVRNTGSRPVPAGDVTLVYRWMRDGAVVAEGANQGQPRGPLAPGVSAPVRLAIATVGAGATPLASGAYVLRVEAKHPGGTTVYDQDVVVAPADSVEIAGSTLPSAVRSGGIYPVTLRVRLAASEGLAAGAARIVWQILSADGLRVLAAGANPIERPLAPSVWHRLPVSLRVADPADAPLDGAFPERQVDAPNDPNRWGMRVRWAIAREDGTLLPGGAEERVAVYPIADLARVQAARVPTEPVAADALFSVTVRVSNTGTERWQKGKIALTGRWFQADGFPMPLVAALPSVFLDHDVAVGESVEVAVPCRAPLRDGRYILGVFVNRPPDGFFAVQPLTETADSAFVPVTVTGGRLAHVDLTARFDVDAVSWEPLPRDGDLDGSGATLPGEWFPADRHGVSAGLSIYPSGYFADIASDIVRATTFRFGPADDGRKNAVACRGQAIDVPRDRYVALHVAAVSTGAKATELTLTLRYRDGKTETVKRPVRAWTDPVGANEAIALRFPRRRTPSGDLAQTAAVQHVVIPVQAGSELQSVSLPAQPEIKVFAMSLER